MSRITRRALIGALAAAPLAKPAIIRAQTNSTPIKIGLLSDVGGPYKEVGGPGSKLAAEMAVQDFGGLLLDRAVEVIQGDDQNNRDRGASRDATPPTPPGIRVRTAAVRRIRL